MSINFTAKNNVKLTGALKAFTEKNLETIAKIAGDIIDAEVIVSEEKLVFRVEMSVKTRMQSFHIEAKDAILKQALRTALNTLKAQAKKNKDKMTEEKKRRGKEKEINSLEIEEKPERKSHEKHSIEEITVSYNFSKKPISVEEAVFFLKESGENAYMFHNIETKKMAVIFYDNKRNISIIEE